MSYIRWNSRVRLSRNLTLTSVFAGLYAALVVVFAGNSVYPFQVRVADVLMPMAILFGWPAILGLAIGAGIGNLGADALSGFAPASIGIDIVGGSLANLAAGFLAWKIGGQGWRADGRTFWALGSLGLALAIVVALQSFITLEWVVLIVVATSGILAFFIRQRGWTTTYNISWPLATAFESIVISTVVGSYLGYILPFPESLQAGVLGVLFGSIIAVNIGGLLLLNTVGQARTLKVLKSWGVTVYEGPTQENVTN